MVIKANISRGRKSIRRAIANYIWNQESSCLMINLWTMSSFYLAPPASRWVRKLPPNGQRERHALPKILPLLLTPEVRTLDVLQQANLAWTSKINEYTLRIWYVLLDYFTTRPSFKSLYETQVHLLCDWCSLFNQQGDITSIEISLLIFYEKRQSLSLLNNSPQLNGLIKLSWGCIITITNSVLNRPDFP